MKYTLRLASIARSGYITSCAAYQILSAEEQTTSWTEFNIPLTGIADSMRDEAERLTMIDNPINVRMRLQIFVTVPQYQASQSGYGHLADSMIATTSQMAVIANQGPGGNSAEKSVWIDWTLAS